LGFRYTSSALSAGDEVGRLLTATLPNGVQTAYGYDDADRLTLIEHRNAMGGLLARYEYELDDVGNRVQASEFSLPVDAGGGLAGLQGGELASGQVGELASLQVPGGLSAQEVIEQVTGQRAQTLTHITVNAPFCGTITLICGSLSK
jgi:YD repeat-containing protein